VRGGPSLASASSALAQAAALRAAFPGYEVTVRVDRRDRPRFEAVSREGGDPYCLISSDVQEIWRELRGTVNRRRTRCLPGRA
jgi:hypothetical protein